MIFEQYVHLLGLRLECQMRAPGDWYAHCSRVEVKEGSVLKAVYGDGATPDQAVRLYAKALAGRRIVLNATGPNRIEYEVPARFQDE